MATLSNTKVNKVSIISEFDRLANVYFVERDESNKDNSKNTSHISLSKFYKKLKDKTADNRDLREKVIKSYFYIITKKYSGNLKPDFEEVEYCFDVTFTNFFVEGKESFNKSGSFYYYFGKALYRNYISNCLKKVKETDPYFKEILAKLNSRENIETKDVMVEYDITEKYDENELEVIEITPEDEDSENELRNTEYIEFEDKNDSNIIISEDTNLEDKETKTKYIWIKEKLYNNIRDSYSEVIETQSNDFDTPSKSDFITKFLRSDNQFNFFGQMLFPKTFDENKGVSYPLAYSNIFTKKEGVKLYTNVNDKQKATKKLIHKLSDAASSISVLPQSDINEPTLALERLTGWRDINCHYPEIDLLVDLLIKNTTKVPNQINFAVTLNNKLGESIFSYQGNYDLSKDYHNPLSHELFEFNLSDCTLFTTIEPFISIIKKGKKEEIQFEEFLNQLKKLKKIVVGVINPINNCTTLTEIAKSGVLVEFFPLLYQKKIMEANSHLSKNFKPYNLFSLIEK